MIILISIAIALYLLGALGMMSFLDGNPVVGASTGQMIRAICICAIFWPLTLIAVGCYEVAKFLNTSQ